MQTLVRIDLGEFLDGVMDRLATQLGVLGEEDPTGLAEQVLDNAIWARVLTMVRLPDAALDIRFSKSLIQGLSLLACFTGGDMLFGIADLATLTGMSRSSTHRYVMTLVKMGILQQDPITKKYELAVRPAWKSRKSKKS
jgi:hypothetical protein